MPSDLERAFAALSAKNKPYSDLWDYYHNRAPLAYTNERLRELFRNLDARFTENWCAVVVDAACDRINLTGLRSQGQGQAALDRLWQQGDLSIIADDAHEAALVCGEAFVIAWPNARGVVRAYYHDPRLVHIAYNVDDPYEVDWAAKWYTTGEGKRRLIMYYADRIERYLSTVKSESVTAATALAPDPDSPQEDNPYGVVPVFHLRMRSDCRSELQNVVPVQNGMNKLLADMLVAAEFGAMRQRWIIANAESIGQLRNAPNEIWSLPAGDGVGQQTQVGQFEATELKNFMDPIESLALHLSVITRTPKHYFIGQGGDPSGEALIAMEAPLVRKCSDYIIRFAPAWRSLAAFMLRLGGDDIDAQAITPVYDDPATVQPRTRAEIRKLTVEAGVPLVTTLRREGWTNAEIAQLEQDRAAADERQQATLASALVDAQRRMDQGQDVTPNG